MFDRKLYEARMARFKRNLTEAMSPFEIVALDWSYSSDKTKNFIGTQALTGMTNARMHKLKEMTKAQADRFFESLYSTVKRSGADPSTIKSYLRGTQLQRENKSLTESVDISHAKKAIADLTQAIERAKQAQYGAAEGLLKTALASIEKFQDTLDRESGKAVARPNLRSWGM